MAEVANYQLERCLHSKIHVFLKILDYLIRIYSVQSRLYDCYTAMRNKDERDGKPHISGKLLPEQGADRNACEKLS